MSRTLSTQARGPVAGLYRCSLRPQKRLQNPLRWAAFLVVLSIVGLFASYDASQSAYVVMEIGYFFSTAPDVARNSQEIQEWRSQTAMSCRSMMDRNDNKDSPTARQQKEQVEREAISKLQFPTGDIPESLPFGHQPYQYCRNVFIDLGTNIGDSIGYFLDTALDVCSPIWMESLPGTKLNAEFPRPHMDVTTLEVLHTGVESNPLYVRLLRLMAQDSSPAVMPNSFCLYGMEGNPLFTERLQKLENYVMQTQPRPIRHLHIHTESVITAVDGPTKLFLDTRSVNRNFWGSSIFSSGKDAVASAKDLGSEQLFSADVEGISLSTLTKRTVLAFKPNASPEEMQGGFLIIKMDVEGAEFQVLKEVVASGVLCDYSEKGNRVVIFVELHKMGITDPVERERELTGYEEARKTLEDCGVTFGRIQGHWK